MVLLKTQNSPQLNERLQALDFVSTGDGDDYIVLSGGEKYNVYANAGQNIISPGKLAIKKNWYELGSIGCCVVAGIGLGLYSSPGVISNMLGDLTAKITGASALIFGTAGILENQGYDVLRQLPNF